MSAEASAVQSVVVAFDGEAKCGKTTMINTVAEEARFQANLIPSVIATVRECMEIDLDDSAIGHMRALHEHITFKSITKISAGNAFRAAAFYKALLELDGTPKQHFEPADANSLREMLATPGITDILQDDPNVGKQVSPTAQLLGAQALCGSIFCDSIAEAYHANRGGNLVIVDARDPVGTMHRNGLLGKGRGQIDPAGVIPVYIDTPTEVAAARMSGDYAANLAEVADRRHMDATRAELPVIRPPLLIEDFAEWTATLAAELPSREDVAHPYRLDNGGHATLETIQGFSARLALVAQEIGHSLFHAHSDVPCWDPANI